MPARREFVCAVGTALALPGCAGLSGSGDETPTGTAPASAEGSDTPTPDLSSLDTDPVAQFQYDAHNTGVRDEVAPATADVRWRTRLQPVDGGMTVTDDHLLVTVGGSVVALDTGGGERRWTADVGHDAAAAPAVGGDLAIVTTWNGGADVDRGVVALDLADGTELWRAIPDVDVDAAPTLADGTVYVGGSLHSDEVVAIDAATGDVRWRKAVGDYAPTPAVAEGVVYVGGGSNEFVRAMDAETGQTLWERDLDGRVWGAPTVVDDVVYAATRNGTVAALGAADGDPRWTGSVDGDVNRSPAVANGVVYAPGDGFVAAVDRSETVWKTDVTDRAHAPTVTDDAVVVADGRRAYCLGRADGDPRWTHEVAEREISDAVYGGVRSAPVVHEGTVYVAAHGGVVYALGPQE